MVIPTEITPATVAEQLLEKHEKALKISTEEFEKYQALEHDLDSVAENNKSERDKINKTVQEQKELRQSFYTESKELRKEFTTKTAKQKSMANIPMEVLILTKQIDQLEWEIQTEATNVDDEKKLVKHIQDNIEKMHNYANMYQEHEAVSNTIKKLTSSLRRKLRKAEQAHQTMLAAVNKSDTHHKNFVEAVMKLRDARTKRVGFQHEVEKHKKALDHWKKIMEKERKASKKTSGDRQNKETSSDIGKESAATKQPSDSTEKKSPKPKNNRKNTTPKPSTPDKATDKKEGVK
jgi:uncharacterized coiled-coil DUF342 family protein